MRCRKLMHSNLRTAGGRFWVLGCHRTQFVFVAIPSLWGILPAMCRSVWQKQHTDVVTQLQNILNQPTNSTQPNATQPKPTQPNPTQSNSQKIETHRFILTFTRTSYWTLSSARWIQFIHLYSVYWRSILILFQRDSKSSWEWMS